MQQKTPTTRRKRNESYWRMRFASLYLRKNSEYRETIPMIATLDDHTSHMDTTTMPTITVVAK
jgi:hypothetical protein